MYKYVILLISVLSVVVAGYDFKDSDYNEYLMQDLIDAAGEHDSNEYLWSVRNRRDVDKEKASEDDKKCKPKRGSPFSKCCNDNVDYNHETYEKFKDVKKQCFQEIRGPKAEDPTFDMFSCEKINKTKEELTCVMLCVGNKFKLLDSDGNLLEDPAKSYVRDNVAQSDWQKDVADKVSDRCLTEAREVGKLNESAPSKKCNGSLLKFGHCLFREFFKSCPKEMQSDTPKCLRIRDKLEKGEKIDYHQLRHRFHDSDDK